MSNHYDDLETRTPEARAASQLECLRAQISDAQQRSPGFARHLAGLDASSVQTPADVARIPVLRKSALIDLQRQDPPFGGLTTRDASEFTHLFQSPGPIHEPGLDTPDWWRFARALHAAGIRAGDRVLNCFSYHLTPAGHMFDNALRAMGAAVLPGGVGNTDAQCAAACALRATAYVGTPDFLKVLIERADALGLDLSAIKVAVVGGGPLFPAIREFYGTRGIVCVQGYGTADLGSIAYETLSPDGTPNPGMMVDEGVIVEIVRPGTGDPVRNGEVGEVVVTMLNADYPLTRFATGDLSAFLDAPSPCGRTGPRIKGWMGRADQTTKVRGMFVRPEQIAEVLKRHPEIGRARLTVDRDGDQDAMRLSAEGAGLNTEAIAATLRDVLKLRGDVSEARPGSLPNDGKVIDDIRKFET